MSQWKRESRSTHSPVLTVNGSPSSLLLSPKPVSPSSPSPSPSPIPTLHPISHLYHWLFPTDQLSSSILYPSPNHQLLSPFFFFFLEPSETTSQLGSLMLLWSPQIILCRAARGILGKLSFQSLPRQNNKWLNLPGIRISSQ